MVRIETYDDTGALIGSITVPDSELTPDQLALRDALVAINPDTITSLVTSKTQIANIKAVLTRMAKMLGTEVQP